MNRPLTTAAVFVLSLCLTACSGSDGTNGTNGLITLATVTTEPAGANCPDGGQKVSAGLDTDRNGVLDASEMTSTYYVCNGANGASGSNGSNGLTTLATATAEPAGANCANGGQKVSSGLDADRNGVLDPSESTVSYYLCNGAIGTSGTNGLTTLATVTTEPAGSNCANGGQKVSAGLDTDRNNVLDPSEGTAHYYLCNGLPGPGIPVIQGLYATGLPASPGGTVTARVSAQSAEGLPLSYSWSVSGGWSIASGGSTTTVTLTAPNAYGASSTASITVSDTQGRTATAAVGLSTATDFMPIIESIAIYPQPVYTWANLVAGANDLFGDSLTYTWTVGGISGIAYGSSALWQSPGIPGYYTVSVAVSDGTTTVTGPGAMTLESASPWPKFRRDLQGTGRSPIMSSPSGSLKWSYTTGGYVSSSPAIGADGTVYIGSGDNKLYAINPNGTFKWSYTTGGPVTSSPAIGADGTVYVGSNDGKLYAINPDGTLKWSYTTGGQESSPAIGADGTVYVGSSDWNLFAINPNGTLKWSYSTGHVVSSSPSIGADGTIYVGSQDNNKLHAINPNGTLKWSYTTGLLAIWRSSPAVGADGSVYVGTTGSGSGALYAINPDGTFKWSYTTGGPVTSSPAIGADGTVYIGSWDYYLYAINPNGTLKWSYNTGWFVDPSSPAIGADGTVYIGNYDNKLFAINSNGTLKWSYTTGGAVQSSPAIGADGTVYIGSGDNKLYAIK